MADLSPEPTPPSPGPWSAFEGARLKDGLGRPMGFMTNFAGFGPNGELLHRRRGEMERNASIAAQSLRMLDALRALARGAPIILATSPQDGLGAHTEIANAAAIATEVLTALGETP